MNSPARRVRRPAAADPAHPRVWLLPLVAALAALPALAAPRASVAPAAGAPFVRPPGFRVNWDPQTGRGPVSQRLENGDLYIACFHCQYPGYTGGLWLGSFNGSGFLYVPVDPPPGFATLNLFCAQDESLFDEDTGVEYDGGWSENFGFGNDGEPLPYLAGAVVEDGSRGGDVVLRAVNAGGCYALTRHVLWPRGAGYLVFSTVVENVCARPVRFAFWTGDDPWIGRYASSEGDVGFAAPGLLPRETVLDPRTFGYVGMLDLGNVLTGEPAGAFSNVADVLLFDPGQPAPQHGLVANGFAHAAEEVDPTRPLDNRSPTAFNVGYTGVRLAPGEAVRLRYALGRATPQPEGRPPLPPAIPAAHWAFADRYEGPVPPLGQVRPTPLARPRAADSPIAFREEDVRLVVEPPYLLVEGHYTFENRSAVAHTVPMLYPFPLDADHPYPDLIEVAGAPFVPHPNGIVWRLAVEAHAEKTVVVRYAQQCRVPLGRYILTTTAHWGTPFARAHYEVRWPITAAPAHVNYPGVDFTVAGETWRSLDRVDFLPDRDLVVRWSAPR